MKKHFFFLFLSSLFFVGCAGYVPDIMIKNATQSNIVVEVALEPPGILATGENYNYNYPFFFASNTYVRKEIPVRVSREKNGQLQVLEEVFHVTSRRGRVNTWIIRESDFKRYYGY